MSRTSAHSCKPQVQVNRASGTRLATQVAPVLHGLVVVVVGKVGVAPLSPKRAMRPGSRLVKAVPSPIAKVLAKMERGSPIR